MKLIDKDKIVAEIERIKKEDCPTDTYEGRCKLFWFEQFLSFINTLEGKEVDLEKEIKNRIDSLSNLYCYMEDLFNGNEEEGVYPIPEIVTNELFEFAKYFYELGLKAKGE